MTRPLLTDLFLRAFWLPTLVFLVYVCATMTGLTGQLPDIDMVFHLVGGFSIGYCVSRSLECLTARSLTGGMEELFRSGFILGMTAMAALFWEFAEFTLDRTIATRFQADLTDTMSDLALGLVGGMVFLVLRRLAVSRNSGP